MPNDPRIWGTHLKRREVVMVTSLSSKCPSPSSSVLLILYQQVLNMGKSSFALIPRKWGERRNHFLQICVQLAVEEILDHVYFVHPSTDVSVDISTDSRPMYRSTYQSSIGRYVDRHIGRESADMSSEMCRSTYRPMYIGRMMVNISTEISSDSRPI